MVAWTPTIWACPLASLVPSLQGRYLSYIPQQEASLPWEWVWGSREGGGGLGGCEMHYFKRVYPLDQGHEASAKRIHPNYCLEHRLGLWGRRHGPSQIRRHMGEAGVGGMGRQLGSAASAAAMRTLGWSVNCDVLDSFSMGPQPEPARKKILYMYRQVGC